MTLSLDGVAAGREGEVFHLVQTAIEDVNTLRRAARDRRRSRSASEAPGLVPGAGWRASASDSILRGRRAGGADARRLPGEARLASTTALATAGLAGLEPVGGCLSRGRVVVVEAASASGDGVPVSATPGVLDARMHERLARTVQAKLARGYRIEDQGDSQVVLVANSRRWFGLFGGRQTRELVSINAWGHPSVEGLEAAAHGDR